MFHNDGDSWDSARHCQLSGWQSRGGSHSHDASWWESQEGASSTSWKKQRWQNGKWEQRRRSRSRSWQGRWQNDKHEGHGAVLGGAVLLPRTSAATLKSQVANGVELIRRERPQDCVFQVSGAGGKGSVVDGQYKHFGSMEGKPMYKQVGGDGILYCFEFWKITPKGDTTGWFYAAPSSGNEPEPPSGMWTTEGYNGGNVDPPPVVTKLDKISAAKVTGARRAVRLGPAKRVVKSAETTHQVETEGIDSSTGAGDGSGDREVVDLMSSPSRSPRPARATSLLGGGEVVAALKAKLKAMKARKQQPEAQDDEMSGSPTSASVPSGPPGVWDGPPLPEAAAGPPIPVAPPWAGMGPGIAPGVRPPFGFKPSRMRGWVTQFWPERQSGYLSSNFIQFGTELYFDIHGPQKRTLQVGDAVDFSPGRSPFGEPIAVNVVFDSFGACAQKGEGVASSPKGGELPVSQVDASALQ